MTTRQGGNSWKYLYERLGDKRFQQLCNALLAHEFPDVTCFPVGQKDGGRDAVRKSVGGSVIYQVKWTNTRKRNPVAWLDKAIKGEEANITRLVSEGAKSYYLMTCVAGTSAYGRGTMDRLDEILAERSRAFGIPMECWWQADIDARIDKAPKELKWAYADMLAGHDLVRYLIEADRIEAQDQELHTLLLKVIATQWREDSKVKFKQVELDTHDLADLFVDVEARMIAAPRAAMSVLPSRSKEWLGGTAEYLLNARQPLTLVRGEPGQGKSTLGQYLCQVHRAEYLKKANYLNGRRPEATVAEPRLPVRIDLRDYALWMDGGDPFTDIDPSEASRKRVRKQASLEVFLARMLEARSGGMKTAVTTVQDILNRFPMLVLLDGLDEVAQDTTRERVVKEIDEFVVRLGTSLSAPQVVVTARPNASGLPEPSAEMFETISLVRLSPALRSSYLRKWADAQAIYGPERQVLQQTFNHRSAEPHISQLAANPMQLTILLYLMHKRGDSVPTGRTGLYSSYMETFLDRESAKSPAVHDHREDLEEITAFLGWYLQALAETKGTNGQLPTKSIRAAINNYLFAVEKDTSLVDDLFKGVTDRVWALTSKVQGTFEFDVQSVREYFAAKYLYEFAGAEAPKFQKSMLLRQLVRRPYWLNISRFYGGFANPNEITGLVEGLEEEFEDGRHPGQVRAAAWSLLSDGVFSSRTKTQKRAAALFEDDLSIRFINHALHTETDVVPLAADRGATSLVDELRAQIALQPEGPLTIERVRLAARLLPDAFRNWWLLQMEASLGRQDEVAWLRIGTPFQAARSLQPEHVNRLILADAATCAVAVDSGVVPPPGSPLEERLVRAVLDGLCSEFQNTAAGLAGDLVRVLGPQHFLRRARGDERAFAVDVGHVDTPMTSHQRLSALERLKSWDSRFELVQKAMRFAKGEYGTTSPWGNTAREVGNIFGACWLAAEIALMGAALPESKWMTGGYLTKGSEPFGPTPDYGRLAQDVRLNRSRSAWWHDQFDGYGDPLSRCTWVLALLAVAAKPVVVDCFECLSIALSSLPAPMVSALCLSSSRLGASGVGHRLDADLLGMAASLPSTAILLLTHHIADLERPGDLATLSDTRLAEMGAFGVAGWPASRALTARMLTNPSESALKGLRAHGPCATVDVGTDTGNIPNSLMATILESPASYPLSWLLAAEIRISQNSQEPYLAEVAEAEGWFSQ